MTDDIIAISRDFNIYVQYDSDTIQNSDKYIEINLPQDGWYYITLHNISIKFNDAYTPDDYTGFLILTDTNISQSGNTKINLSISKPIRGIYFPLIKPSILNPKCKTYNKVQFNAQDKFKLVYTCKTGLTAPLDRLTLTIHITNNLRYVYID